jgi:hypothetical protein
VVDEKDEFPTLASNLLIASNTGIHDEFKKIVFSNINKDLKIRFN